MESLGKILHAAIDKAGNVELLKLAKVPVITVTKEFVEFIKNPLMSDFETGLRKFHENDVSEL